MIISSRLIYRKIWQNLYNAIGKEVKAISSVTQTFKTNVREDENEFQSQVQQLSNLKSIENYRYMYPEFLPDPNPLYRNSVRERLERMDMLTRRLVINIPEFYVGSILAVTYSEPHAVDKVNRFVGICILRRGCGLRASFILRNVVNNEAVEVNYDLYDPALQKIECLRLEKRLDNELLYLRDAPLEYSTFPFDMEKELLTEGTAVPVNELKVTLNPQPWLEKWERKDLKGVKDIVVNEKRQRKAKAAAKPWEKYDLMKIYRSTISEEEQNEIYSALSKELDQLEIKKSILKRARTFTRPKKIV